MHIQILNKFKPVYFVYIFKTIISTIAKCHLLLVLGVLAFYLGEISCLVWKKPHILVFTVEFVILSTTIPNTGSVVNETLYNLSEESFLGMSIVRASSGISEAFINLSGYIYKTYIPIVGIEYESFEEIFFKTTNFLL